MKKNKYYLSVFLLSAGSLFSLSAQKTATDDPLLSIVEKEITRNLDSIKLPNLATPFFIDYRIEDNKSLRINASRGSLISSDMSPLRLGGATLLVGNYEMNNISQVPYLMIYRLPTGTNEQALRASIWLQIDNAYKRYAEGFEGYKSAINQMIIPEDMQGVPNFEKREPVVKILPLQPIEINKKELEEYAVKASALLNDCKDADKTSVTLNVTASVFRYFNTEGTKVLYPNNRVELVITIQGQSPDGEEITQLIRNNYTSPKELPDQKTLAEICTNGYNTFCKQLQAPMVKEAYSGPVLFEGGAVANCIIQSMINPQRGLKSSFRNMNGPLSVPANELETMLNKKIISRDLTITSLSGTETYNGTPLLGYFPVDMQGVVPDKELILVENGVLKNLLTSRKPSKRFPHSNGHSRNPYSDEIVPGVIRMSSKGNTNSSAELKQKLIKAAQEEDYEYAYIVRSLVGEPFQLYRINVNDGSEELLRGGRINDMSLKSFKRILGVSENEIIHNILSGNIGNTYIVPESILFEEVDIVKNTNTVLKKPFILEKPDTK